MYCTHVEKTRISRILVKEIISSKNKKVVYSIQDDEGVFCTDKKVFKSIHFVVEEKVATNA